MVGKSAFPKNCKISSNDVASLKKHLVLLEDRQLEHMEAVETAQDRLSDAESGLDQAKASWTTQTAHLHAELSQSSDLTYSSGSRTKRRSKPNLRRITYHI